MPFLRLAARRTFRSSLLFGLCAVAVALGGCGGSGTPSSAPSSASSSAPSARSSSGSSSGTPAAASPAASETAPSAAASRPPSGAATAEFCSLAKQQAGGLDAAATARLISGGTPAEWKAFLDTTTRQNAALVAAAPPQIADAVATLNQTTVTLRAAMEKAGYDLDKVDKAALASLNTSDAVAAGQKLQKYLAATCGIGS